MSGGIDVDDRAGQRDRDDIGPQPARSTLAALVLAAWAAGTLPILLQLLRVGDHTHRGVVHIAVGTSLLTLCLIVPLNRSSLRRPSTGLATTLATAAAVATIGWAPPAIGRTPAVVAVVATSVAAAACTPLHPSRTRTRATLALPFVAIATMCWLRTTSAVATGLLLGTAIAIVVLHHVLPHAAARVDRRLSRAVTRASSVIAGVPLLALAMVTLYLPGAAAAVVIHHRRRRAQPSWHEVQTDVAGYRRDETTPFATPEPRQRARALLFLSIAATTIVLATFALGPIRGARSTSDRLTSLRPSNAIGKLDAARGLDYVEALAKEQTTLPLVPYPPSTYRVGDFSGTYSNELAGIRRSVEPPRCRHCDTLEVWFTGGSAGWGQGQRDLHTIPSELVRLARADDIAIDVSNIAALGWTLWQEYQDVLARLDTAEDAPDVVIFYDGFNDIAFTLATELRGRNDWSKPVVYDQESIESLLRDHEATTAALDRAGDTDDLARRAARRYADLRRTVAATLAERGVASIFYFQVDAGASPAQRAGLDTSGDLTPALLDLLDEAMMAAVDELGEEEHRTRNLFDGLSTPVLFDVVHLNERGARLIAEDLFAEHRDVLAHLARRS